MSLNLAIISGNVGQDPKISNGVANFSVATTDKYKNKEGEQVEATEWHNVVAFGKTAEFVERWVKKGVGLSVVGEIQTTKYTHKTYPDVTLYTTKVKANKIDMIKWAEETSKKSLVDDEIGF